MDFSYQTLELYIVPLRNDNYSYVIHDRASQQTLVIDPSETEPLMTFLSDRGFGLDLIIDTHHHDDHTHGNSGLQNVFGSKIVSSQYDAEKRRIPGTLEVGLNDGDRLRFSDYHFRVLTTPGHTLGHICLVLEGANWLFCGDTLFALGCGRLFEGTPGIMWESFKKLRALPDETLVFCGHEYTLANARFASHILGPLPGLQDYIKTQNTRHTVEGRTIPSRLKDEKLYNPFFLSDQPKLRSLGSDPVSVFAEVRRQKDHFS